MYNIGLPLVPSLRDWATGFLSSALALIDFLSKVEHEASFCLPSLYLGKRLVHLFKFADFRDHLRFSGRLKLKRLGQINSIAIWGSCRHTGSILISRMDAPPVKPNGTDLAFPAAPSSKIWIGERWAERRRAHTAKAKPSQVAIHCNHAEKSQY